MSRSVSVFTTFVLFVLIKSAQCEVKSCYACAGPENDCRNETMNCENFKVEGQSLIHRGSELELLERFDAEVGPAVDGAVLGCLSLTFDREAETSKNRVLKTCVPETVFGEDICTYMEELVKKVDGVKKTCRFCKSDDCNDTSAASVPIGKSAMLIVCLVYVIKNFL